MNPILHRLGDLPEGEPVSVFGHIGRIVKHDPDRGVLVAYTTGNNQYEQHRTRAYRLRPETALTRHAGEMREVLGRVASMASRSRYPGEVGREAADLLSRIAASKEQTPCT